MSSKWASDDEEKSGIDDRSPRTPNSPPSEHKEGGNRRPRRSRPGRGDTPAEDSKDEIESRPSVKTIAGGWGLDAADSTTSDAQSKSVIGGMTTMEQKEAEGRSARASRRTHFDNDETEILVIPDLEDDGEEDIVSKVAAAPKNTTRRVPTLRELDEDLKYSVPSAADGLDMSLLTKTLVPPEMLEEDDSPWDFDSLLQAVTQEFNAEKMSPSNPYAGNSDDGTGSTLQTRASSRLQGGSRYSPALVA